MKMKKFTLIILSVVLLFTFQASQRPNVAAVNARADEMEVWNLYRNNWLIVPDESELVEEYVAPDQRWTNNTNASIFNKVDLVTSGTFFTLSYALDPSGETEFLWLYPAKLSTLDNSYNYVFVFSMTGMEGHAEIEDLTIPLLISAGTTVENLNLANVLSYDLTYMLCYGLQVYVLDNIKFENGLINWSERENISPIPFFSKALYTTIASRSFSYAQKAIYPAACVVAGENSDKFFGCDFGTIITDVQYFNNYGSTYVLSTYFEYLNFQSFVQFDTTNDLAYVSGIALNGEQFKWTNSINYGGTMTEAYNAITEEEYQNGDIIEFTYFTGEYYRGKMGYSSTFTVPPFNIAYGLCQAGSMTQSAANYYMKTFDTFQICAQKINAQDTPTPTPTPPSEPQPSTFQKVYSVLFAGIWAGIALAVVYPIMAVVDLGSLIFTGQTVWVDADYGNVAKTIYDSLYNFSINATRVISDFTRRVGNTLKTFFTDTLPGIIEKIPGWIDDTVDFVENWWWALAIGGLVVLAAVVAIIIINQRR